MNDAEMKTYVAAAVAEGIFASRRHGPNRR